MSVIQNKSRGPRTFNVVEPPYVIEIAAGRARSGFTLVDPDHPATKSQFLAGELVVTDEDDFKEPKPEPTPEPTPDEARDRDNMIIDAINTLGPTDFTSSGLPKVDAINHALPSGATLVTSEERDRVWEKKQGS